MASVELSQRALDWCAAQVPGARRVLASKQLHGGIAAITHAVSLELDDGALRELVLRRFAGPVTREWPPVEREVAALSQLSEASFGFAIPRVVAHDATGVACDLPAILLTRLSGTIDVSLSNVEGKARELGRVLAALHRVALQPPAGFEPFAIDFERRKQASPLSAVDWNAVWDALRELEYGPEQLLHGDFHLGNTLFEAERDPRRGKEERITGVVDWTLVRSGPPVSEVGYCRVDLALLFGLEAADIFLEAYEAAHGERVRDRARWDLAGATRAYPDPASWLPGWTNAGRDDLDADLVRRRLVAYVERALREL
jgi:aminoglycoside phosphotransferase (APT) family kinase protein